MPVPVWLLQGVGHTFDSCEANLKWCNLPHYSGSEEVPVKVAEWPQGLAAKKIKTIFLRQ